MREFIRSGCAALALVMGAGFGASCATADPLCEGLTPAGGARMPLDAPWKQTLQTFAQANVKHSAWGLAHSQRNYGLALALARRAGVAVDEEVLFAAALLHDLGGLPGFEVEGVSHEVRSAELAGEKLPEMGFPAAKLALVKEVILSHNYSKPMTSTAPEAIAFRDADLLDFMGAIGYARIASLTEREAFTPNLTKVQASVTSLNATMPGKLIWPVSKCLGLVRTAEWNTLNGALLDASFGGDSL